MGAVETPWGTVRIKRSAHGTARNVSVEFEDCAALAKKSDIPVKEVIAVAAALARKESASDW